MFCNKLICLDKKPEESWKLFFGDNGNFLRVDKCDYKVFANLYEKTTADFWTRKVVDFSKDRVGWDNFDDNAKRIFLLNNGYQSVMDSGVTSVFGYLAEICSNTELKALYKYNDFIEVEHAMSYSYGLSQMFGGEAESKIDIVYEDAVVKQRMENEISYTDEFFKHIMIDKKIDDKAKELILKEMIVTYVLEHIKFPFSFFVTWRLNIGYNNAIQGFSQLLKLIANDELTTHVTTHINVFKILNREDRQGFKKVIQDNMEWIYNYFKLSVKQEIEWNDYLFNDGAVNSFTKDMGEHFIKYYADLALTKLGLAKIYNEQKSELIIWYDTYRDINKQNSALQEVSNIAYQKGITKNDLHKFDNFIA